MTDYNFFEGYQVKKAPRSTSATLLNMLLMIVLLGTVGIISFNYYTINEQQKELNRVKSEIDTLKQTEEVIRISEKQMLKDALDRIITSMRAAGEDINQQSIINENLLISLSDSLPSDVKFGKLSVAENSILISGYAAERAAIAEFEYNLNQLQLFDSIFVSEIFRKEGFDTYEFEMTLMIGGVVNEDQ